MTLLLRPLLVRSILTGFAILSAIAAPLVAQGNVIQSAEGLGLALVETTTGYRIENPSGSAATIDVPPGTLLTAFRELAGGWIAAGHRPTAGGNEVVLLLQIGQKDRTQLTGLGVERLAPPAGGGDHTLRIAPVPLIDNGRLAGLAWLEGDGGEKNAVMASKWTGKYWAAVETVAPRTGEAQLALSGAILNDGSSLLVWAAVAGNDDEIMWSRSVPGGWSRPERVHLDNDVADIVPKLVAVDDGALVAWSQYDGKDYRLRVSRFADGGWIDTGFVGEKGSLYPTQFATVEGAGFLYQVAAPSSWSLIEIDSSGRLRRRAAVDRQAGQARPLVFENKSSTAQLRFVSRIAEEAPSDSSTWHRFDWIEQP